MNKFLFAAALAATCGAAAAQQQPLNSPAGTLKVVTGDVRVMGADSAERAVAPGDRIASTERLMTGPGSAASVVLRDGTVMALGPRSNVDLRRFTYDSTTQEGSLSVAILRGSMRMITGLISKANRDAVTVTARTTTVGVRGTDFIVSLDEDAP